PRQTERKLPHAYLDAELLPRPEERARGTGFSRVAGSARRPVLRRLAHERPHRSPPEPELRRQPSAPRGTDRLRERDADAAGGDARRSRRPRLPATRLRRQLAPRRLRSARPPGRPG